MTATTDLQKGLNGGSNEHSSQNDRRQGSGC